MDTVKTLNKTEYEWLLSGDKITIESLYADFQEIGKVVDTPSIPFNWNETIKSPSPLISFANFFWQTKYDIVNSTKDNLEFFLAKSISQVPEVEYILISKIANYYEIWIVINKLDREVRERIYDIEYDILEHFGDNYFDFHVICRDDRNIGDICPPNTIIYYRKKV
ncbi:MAG: hypothetical protein ACLP2P_13620 [Desulfobaccales bacterium]